MKTPNEIIGHMLKNDAYSQWLGISLVSVGDGTCQLEMTVREEMLNGFGILHGGITYALADSALAFAANSFGKHALSIETSITHHAKVHLGQKLNAEATLIHRGSKFSSFNVAIKNENCDLVASFRGGVFNTQHEWDFL